MFSQPGSVDPSSFSFLQVTVRFCLAHAERRWSWRGLSDAKESLKKEKCCYRLHMLGELIAGEEGAESQRRKWYVL